jgi:hypothetical protein
MSESRLGRERRVPVVAQRLIGHALGMRAVLSSKSVEQEARRVTLDTGTRDLDWSSVEADADSAVLDARRVDSNASESNGGEENGREKRRVGSPAEGRGQLVWDADNERELESEAASTMEETSSSDRRKKEQRVLHEEEDLESSEVGASGKQRSGPESDGRAQNRRDPGIHCTAQNEREASLVCLAPKRKGARSIRKICQERNRSNSSIETGLHWNMVGPVTERSGAGNTSEKTGKAPVGVAGARMFKMALPQGERKERPGVRLPAARIHLSTEENPIDKKGAGALPKSRRDTAARRKSGKHPGESNVVADAGSKLQTNVPSVDYDKKELERSGPLRSKTQEITEGGSGEGREEHIDAVCAIRALRDGHKETKGTKAGQAADIRLQNEHEGRVGERKAEREKRGGLPMVAGKMLSHALGLTQRGWGQIGSW